MRKTVLLAGAYLASIFAANYAITHVGSQAFPGGPHTLPVGFGLAAPSGVYVVGLTLVLRDVVQRRAGKLATFALILAAAGLTWFISPSLALASTAAFAISELVDFAIYTTLERRTFYGAVVGSNLVSVVIDSAAFLLLAFHSLTYIDGQIVGKLEATAAAVVVLAILRGRARVQAATA